MPNKLYLIYKFTSPSNKSYIGQTCDLSYRIWRHQNTQGCPNFYNAIQKYGWETFTCTILKDNLTIIESNYWEEYYINEFNTITPNGYNIAYGGHNRTCSIETKQKMSDNSYWKGTTGPMANRHHTLETIEKMKKPKSKEHIQNMKKPKSIEHRKKLSEVRIGKKKSEHTLELMRRPKPKVICPHCLKQGGRNAMKRYHFDNCKYKK